MSNAPSPLHGFPEITEKDLREQPQKVTLVLRWLAEQIVKLQGHAGHQRFGPGQMTFRGSVAAQNGVAVTGETSLSGGGDLSGNYRTLRLENVSQYADNAAALAGGLRAGDVYVTPTGAVMRVY